MFLIFSSGCYLSASLKSLNKTIQNSIGLTRAQPDLTDGQRITTGNGYQVEGSFSEMSEDKALTNGYSIEGVFYE